MKEKEDKEQEKLATSDPQKLISAVVKTGIRLELKKAKAEKGATADDRMGDEEIPGRQGHK